MAKLKPDFAVSRERQLRAPNEVGDPVATDYDAPRKSADEETDSLEGLKQRVPGNDPVAMDADDADNPGFELAGADLSDVELDVVVLPQQADEFTCVNCFLVRHHSQLAENSDLGPVCAECAG